MPDAGIAVLDEGRALRFCYAEMVRYNGGRSPGGVALAYKVLEAILPRLAGGAAVERRALAVRSAFPGPGVRDAFELVTRAVTGDRYDLDPSIALPDNGPTRAPFVFEVTFGDRTFRAALRAGFVTEEFLATLALDRRDDAQERHFTALKDELAERLMAVSGDAAFDVTQLT